MDLEDQEKLIELIKNRPYLYNKTDQFYKDTIKKENAFKEIGEILGTTGEQVKKTWDSIKRQYSNYLKKLNQPSGSGAANPPVFRHSKIMEFYRSFYRPYKTVDNLNDPDDDPILEDLEGNTIEKSGNDIFIEYEGFTAASLPPSVIIEKAIACTPIAEKSRYPSKRKKETLDIDEKLIAALENSNQDSDEFDHFGANVAGRIRKIQAKNIRLSSKLQFEIQKIVYEFEEQLFELESSNLSSVVDQ